MDTVSELERAWRWREKRGLFQDTTALRIFHGPGEGRGTPLQGWAIDRFGDHAWVTEWGTGEGKSRTALFAGILDFLKKHEIRSAVRLARPEKGLPAPSPEILFGGPPKGKIEVREGRGKYLVQLGEGRHPGLFLDHQPLRNWLQNRVQGDRVLNTFAYTGSLSVAAALGSAREVVTLDLSKPSVEWAKENWDLNRLDKNRGGFISGDVFEWLPRFKKEDREFDCIILDPPSFSRGNRGEFSTAKDLVRLHKQALEILSQEGVLVTSINSAKISWEKFQKDVQEACRSQGRQMKILARIDLPESFPTQFEVVEDRYLKGWILRG